VAHWAALFGLTPGGTIVHAPSEVGSEQVMHVPVQALSQQTPLTQKLLLHSPAQAQASPLSLVRPWAPQPPPSGGAPSVAA
jgi:hypothetical protein